MLFSVILVVLVRSPRRSSISARGMNVETSWGTSEVNQRLTIISAPHRLSLISSMLMLLICTSPILIPDGIAGSLYRATRGDDGKSGTPSLQRNPGILGLGILMNKDMPPTYLFKRDWQKGVRARPRRCAVDGQRLIDISGFQSSLPGSRKMSGPVLALTILR